MDLIDKRHRDIITLKGTHPGGMISSRPFGLGRPSFYGLVEGSIFHPIRTHVAITSVFTGYICMVTHTASYPSATLAAAC